MTSSSKTVSVRDSQNFAPPHPAFVSGMGEIRQQTGFQPVLRRKLMAALSMTGRELGLRPANLMVLDTLLSFLPCTDAAGKEMPVTPLHLLTIYASNETISFRARGLTDRQLRRHFDVLERQGLIQRRDSANGKRFPIYQNGQVIGAYGIDLMPLFAQAESLLTRAAQLRAEQQELRGLKAQIGTLRDRLLDQGPALPHEASLWLDQLRNLTRRVGFTLIEAKVLLQRLTGFLNGAQADETPRLQDTAPPAQAPSAIVTPDMSACAGQNVRHNKPKNTYTKKTNSSEQPEQSQAMPLHWMTFTALSEFFPDSPRSLTELQTILQRTAEMLRIDRTLYHRLTESLVPLHCATILDRLLRDHATIQNPDSYLRKVLAYEVSRA